MAMWTRRELKEWAKDALHRNYWKIVLVSAMLMLFGCGGGGYSVAAAGGGSDADSQSAFHVTRRFGEREHSGSNFWDSGFSPMGGGFVKGAVLEQAGRARDMIWGSGHGALWWAAALIIVVVVLAAFVVVLAVDIFLVNPFEVGGMRFMRKSVEDVAQVRELGYAFDHSYKNVVRVMFFKELYIFLWSLLFIIPGIVKMYQYLLVPYLLSEQPDLERDEALRRSREMMAGNKWKAFVLGLSFILWDFLGAMTLGIVTVLYVQPYRHLTHAALYETLKKTYVIENAAPVYGKMQ